jgi:superfamily II DNA or RNA helicase/tetratricopeptide (TPR) repeat protein
MVHLSDPVHIVRARLIAEYEKLSPDEQKVLQTLSVEMQPISRSILQNHCRIRDKFGRQINSQAWRSFINGLIEKGLTPPGDEPGAIKADPLIIDHCWRHAQRTHRLEALLKDYQSHHYSYYPESSCFFTDYDDAMHAMRSALYRSNYKKFERIYDHCQSKYRAEMLDAHPGVAIFNNPFDPALIEPLRDDIHEEILRFALADCHARFDPAVDICAYLTEGISGEKNLNHSYRQMLGIHRLLQGRFEAADAAHSSTTSDLPLLRAVRAALRGDFAAAIPAFEKALKEARQRNGRRTLFFQDTEGALFLLALITARSADSLHKARDYFNKCINTCENLVCGQFTIISRILIDFMDHTYTRSAPWPYSDSSIFSPWVIYLSALGRYWLDFPVDIDLMRDLRLAATQAAAAGYAWFEGEARTLLHHLNGSAEDETASRNHLQLYGHALVDAVSRTTAWERALESLKAIASVKTPPGAPASAQETRLCWQIEGSNNAKGFSIIRLTSCEQKKLKSGRWSQGRKISVKTLSEMGKKMACLTDQDRQILALAPDTQYSWHESAEFIPALQALRGHPAVYVQDNDGLTPISIECLEPILLVKKTSDGFLLRLEPPIREDGVSLQYDAAGRTLQAYIGSDDHRRIAVLIGPDGMVLPLAAEATLAATIGSLSSMIVTHSDLGSDGSAARSVDADVRIHIAIKACGEGLELELRVRPIVNGKLYPVGHGGSCIFERVQGESLCTQRDLADELLTGRKLLERCPVLASFAGDNSANITISQPMECCAVLAELQDCGDQVVLLWPKDDHIVATRTFNVRDMRMQVRQSNDWFGVEGELTLDDGTVLELRQLLDLVEMAPGTRFVEIGKKHFLALTSEFRRRLDDLRSLTQVQGNGLRLNPFSALLLDDLNQESDTILLDDAWKAHVGSLQTKLAATPALPPTFEGELRDYQQEGFAWLMRLGLIGAGACLADDMGLGKTVQALALLLARSDNGPALIVAPTSVCPNWINESTRFTPTLNVSTFGPGDRAKLVADAGPGDIIVCSYGLFAIERVLLTSRSWHTVVLDEAQAIKNQATRRSRTAMELQAGFRLITTGTPVENNLGELWNLFRFLVPGLLGSSETFTARFIAPIEQKHDTDARHRLKKLIQPFILRRMKKQVLDELPPKTEITLMVEPAVEEAAFYEALRRKAMETISEATGDSAGRNMKVLTQLMRLRRACCHSSMAVPEMAIPSSKMAAFIGLVEELIANQHRALVFSQFVDHLTLIRAELDKMNVTYKYLDGSTPARERERNVQEFQKGGGTLFLISLRAGGFGLNLTGADYVIHMDPWWNPAVEDQASDRVHRIGQQRPVTIYRLIMKGTIEEKIVGLHGRKRDLALSLLDGADVSAKISVEELVRMIRE